MNPDYVVSADPGFWGADYYSCDQDAEEYTHTDPDDAVCDALDSWGSLKLSETIKVYALKRRALDPSEPDHASVVERIYEDLDDEYGGGDPQKPTKRVLLAAERLVTAIRDDYDVWQCEEVASATYNVEAWVRECRPRWLSK